jgi:hypothetical protein
VKKLKNDNLVYTERLKSYTNKFYRLYGFVSDFTKSKKYNFNKALETISTKNITQPLYQTNQKASLQTRQPNNLVVHNLCRTLQPPCGTTNLLGLGLKYCIIPPKVTPDIKECMQKLAYRVRMKHHLLTGNRTQQTEYIPQLYIKLKIWNPPPAMLTTEDWMTSFEKNLREASKINNLQNHNFTSLTPTKKKT